MEVLTATVALSAIALYVAGAFAKHRAVQLETRTQVREQFYQKAHKLVADPGIPDEIAHLVRSLVYQVDSKFTAPMLLWTHLIRKVSEPRRSNSKLLKSIDSMSHVDRARFLEVTIIYVLAVTYNNALLGHYLRRSLLKGLFHYKTTNDAQGHKHIQRVKTATEDTRAPSLAQEVVARSGCGFWLPPAMPA